MENITIGQIVVAVGSITALWLFCEKIIKSVDGMLTKKLSPMQKDVEMLSGVTYEILSHLATNNNTGGMKRALDKYVEYKIKS